MLAPVFISVNVPQPYIAGSGNGIVMVNDVPSSRHIFLFDANGMELLRMTASLPNGHYIFNGLDANMQYTVIARDFPPDGTEQRYQPAVWDYVTPATDLTLQQQQELWQSWQTSP